MRSPFPRARIAVVAVSVMACSGPDAHGADAGSDGGGVDARAHADAGSGATSHDTGAGVTRDAGCTMPAAIRSVTASADDGAGAVAENVLDGDASTRWSGPGPGAFIVLDLGDVARLTGITIDWYRGEERTYRFAVAVSADGIAFADVYAGASSGGGVGPEAVTFAEAPARFVRVTVEGSDVNDWASIEEIDADGTVACAEPEPRPPEGALDPFGIRKIYRTAAGGREYYMDMEATTLAELEDGGRMARFNDRVIYDEAGHWTVNGGNIRFVMTTPAGEAPWRNVEMTMEVRMRSGTLLQPYARGEEHSTDTSRAWRGSADKHRIWFDAPARIGYMKELYHHRDNHGYADGNQAVTEIAGGGSGLLDRWVRIKAIVYNLEGDTAVRFETWVDLGLDDSWVKVTEHTDDGGWHVRDVAGFESFMAQMRRDDPANIPRDRDTGEEIRSDEVITWAGDFVSWRSDGAVWDFRNLSCREIAVPPTPP